MLVFLMVVVYCLRMYIWLVDLNVFWLLLLVSFVWFVFGFSVARLLLCFAGLYDYLVLRLTVCFVVNSVGVIKVGIVFICVFYCVFKF